MTRARRNVLIAALSALVLVAVGLAVRVALHFTESPVAGQAGADSSHAPSLGTNATSPEQLQSTLGDMGRQSITWNVTYMSDEAPLDVDLLDASVARGVRHHVITLEFWSLEDEDQVLRKIADGAVDRHLRDLAREMAIWQRENPESELIVRPLHEANLLSYPWGFDSGNGHGNHQDDFAPAWDRIWRVMRAESPQLKFFLCPNGGDDASYYWGVPARQFDYVGHDRYNRSQEYGTWRTPSQVHDRTIRAIQNVYPGKPYVIAETATSEPGEGVTGHSKAEWIAELGRWMNGAAADAGLVAVCYFDHDKSDEPGNGNDWRIHPEGRPGAEESRRTFQSVFADFP